MQLSSKTVHDILSRWVDEGIVTDHTSEYGEPGYSHSFALTDEDTPLVVLGDYWCRCDNGPIRLHQHPNGEHCRDVDCDMAERDNLHEHAYHHPRLWQQLEEQGVQFEWHDEWMVDYESDKAYRTQPDSYGWQPSIVYSEDAGDYLTPDNDVETWIDWATEGPTRRCIPSNVYNAADIEQAGFVKHNGQFESGWHPGQDDDPERIATAMREQYGEDIELLFMLDSTGQFDIAFSAYYRTEENDDDDDVPEGYEERAAETLEWIRSHGGATS